MNSSVSPTAQERALRHVAELASGPPVDPTLRVTLNFHPDRLLHGRPILDALAEDGVYRSQFVTGTSNGGLTAYPGGDRWRWESRIFDGAYDEATAQERPVYGALNFRRKPVGGAPRFSSAHFRLAAQTLSRTTFCYPDSFLEPSDFGVADHRLYVVYRLGDDAVPDDAVDRLAAALRALTRVASPERIAEALLEDQGPGGSVHRTTAEGGYRINDGGYSFRNPANRFAWSVARLARADRAPAP
ncbi:DUF3626 domain-containing protein [Streptomyces virginiae]